MVGPPTPASGPPARTPAPPSGAGSAHELLTFGQVVRFLATRPALATLAGAVVFAAAARLVVGSPEVADAVVVAVIVVLVGPVEWLVHGVLFHAPPASRRQRWLGTGVDHGRHHDDPTDLRWLLLAPSGVVAFGVILAAIAVAIAAAVTITIGTSLAGPALTAVAVAWLALIHYELTHLLIHSRCPIPVARYRRLRTNHLAHHHRRPDRRLGVTTTIGDRLFGTGPA